MRSSPINRLGSEALVEAPFASLVDSSSTVFSNVKIGDCDIRLKLLADRLESEAPLEATRGNSSAPIQSLDPECTDEGIV